jgi:hypothetical protein
MADFLTNSRKFSRALLGPTRPCAKDFATNGEPATKVASRLQGLRFAGGAGSDAFVVMATP